MHKIFGWDLLRFVGYRGATAVLFAVVAVGFWHATASAVNVVSWEDVYDGTVGSAHYSNTPRQSWHHGNCTEEQGLLESYGRIETTTLCVTHSTEAALASYVNSGGTVQYALKKSSDSSYHLLTNVQDPAQPVLLPNNTLLTVSMSGMNSLKLISLDDVHLKLQEVRTATGPSTYASLYTVDEAQAVLVRDAGGAGIYTRHIAVSRNNQFAAIEVYGQGIALVDLTTNRARLIGTDRVASYAQNAETLKLGVSNDGRKVFVTGDKSDRHKMYLVDEHCGRGSVAVSGEIDEPCDSVDLADSVQQKLGSRLPYFVEFGQDSQEVSVLAWSHAEGNSIKLTIRPDAEKKRLAYLALGDSYSSGEGDTEKDNHGKRYYRPLTNVTENKGQGIPKNKCHISTRSYPYKLAVGMQLALDSPKQWDTVACSGAVAWDIKTQGAEDYKGQGGTLKDFDHETFKKNAVRSFTPGQQKQIAFVKKYKPRAITLTVGGNDVGFAEKLTKCANVSVFANTCDIATEEGRPGLGQQILNQYDNLRPLYAELRKASAGRTKIYVLGYPQFINRDESASCGRNIGLLNHAERRMIYESIAYLNDVIKQAARSAGVKYIDVENSLDGGRLCDDGQRYMTGVTGISWPSDGEQQESFHPNAKGNHEIAMTVWDNTNSVSLIDYDVCGGLSKNYCPDESATKEAIGKPSYFAGAQAQPNTHYQNMTLGEQIKSQFMDIILAPFSFASNSIVNIVMRSEPTDLGNFTASEDGSLDVSTVIPSSLPAGYHTLIVTGQAQSGELVRYEQIVQVLGDDPEDVDEDGQADDQQVCGPFMAVSGIDEDNDGIDDACDPAIATVSIEPSPTVTPSPTPSPTLPPGPQPGTGGNGVVGMITHAVNQIIAVIVAVVNLLLSIFRGLRFGLW